MLRPCAIFAAYRWPGRSSILMFQSERFQQIGRLEQLRGLARRRHSRLLMRLPTVALWVAGSIVCWVYAHDRRTTASRDGSSSPDECIRPDNSCWLRDTAFGAAHV